TFRSRGVRAHQVAAVLANAEAPMRPSRSHSAQHLVQGMVHRGLRFRVEYVHGTHQSFERIAGERLLALARKSQTDASTVRLGSGADRVPACLERLDGL